MKRFEIEETINNFKIRNSKQTKEQKWNEPKNDVRANLPQDDDDDGDEENADETGDDDDPHTDFLCRQSDELRQQDIDRYL